MRIISAAVFGILLMSVLSSCVTHQQLVNFREGAPLPDSMEIAYPPDIRIQPNDVLSIKVFSSDETTSAPFNLTPLQVSNNFVNLQAVQLTGYLVDLGGSIDFPVIGTISLKGLTVEEAKNKIRTMVLDYIKDPVVNIRLLNFTVTVSGEVNNPGLINVINERVTLPEVISRAGDMTDYANRSNVLVIREIDGVRTFNRINLQSTDLFNSDFFYMKQNDFVYIEPIRSKAGSVRDQTNKTIPVITAAATLIAVILSITQ